MSAAASLLPGLRDPVHDAQAAFRAVLQALSRPGTLHTIGQAIPGLGLGAAQAHVLLALTDETTAVWWQSPEPQHRDWLRFHTGAPGCDEPAAAAFAVVTDAVHCPPLDAFAAGSAAAPEHSCTLLVEVPSLEHGTALQWQGPGIASVARVAVGGLPPDFWEGWHANHARFPQGVDVIFTCGDRAIGLPRTTRVRRVEGA